MNLHSAIKISDYDYELPKSGIAQYPLKKRDESKLLIYKDGIISSSRFHSLPQFLPAESLMIYNETRVVQARIPFQKETGASIEIFCLEPLWPTAEIQNAFTAHTEVHWNCLIGNSKKWKSGTLTKTLEINHVEVELRADRLSKDGSNSVIRFCWDPSSISFSQILEAAGVIPLPPYMNRPAEPDDKNRYQTIYAHSEGSVAAPTAGLHFTPEVMAQLAVKQIKTAEVTLHVGAGTFKPLASESIEEHQMHTEQIVISRKTIELILHGLVRPLIVVGTTSTRTLESLYWHGVKLLAGKTGNPMIDIKQWDPYQLEGNSPVSPQKALEAILKGMDRSRQDYIRGQTQLMIVPGYRFRLVDVLITNFHMPKSTLLLLVSAFIGEDWKTVYRYALENKFRFLSYGDSCLFFKK